MTASRKTAKPSPGPTEKDALSAPEPAFDELLESLEEIVTRMEAGDMPLEEALREFERGQQLASSCQKRLEAATLKVRNLLEKQTDAVPGDND